MVAKITRQELQSKLNNGRDIILVEALPAKYYQDQHLPGAVNIPHNEVEAKSPQLLANQSAEVIVYCANSSCQNSEIAAKQLLELGYTNVRTYAEGKQDWIEAGLPTESSQFLELAN